HYLGAVRKLFDVLLAVPEHFRTVVETNIEVCLFNLPVARRDPGFLPPDVFGYPLNEEGRHRSRADVKNDSHRASPRCRELSMRHRIPDNPRTRYSIGPCTTCGRLARVSEDAGEWLSGVHD